jgi:hypothetical protein
VLKLNFLLQATRILHVGNYDEDELNMIYNFMSTIDNSILITYNESKTILSYSSDLELYVEIVDTLINIYVEREMYENCQILMKKKEQAITILNN